MINLDSITLAISIDLVEYQEENFTMVTSPDGLISIKVARPKIIGFNKIEVLSDKVRFHISSKILLEKYIEAININTIQCVFEVINKSKYVKLKTNQLHYFELHACDFVANFKTNKPHTNYYQSLNLINNSRYRNVLYNERKSYGFTFIGKQSKNKYFKFYDKEHELSQSYNNQLIRLVGMDNLLKDFKDIIRIEFKAINFKQIRDYCGIINITLDNVLNSKNHPLHKIFCEIIGKFKIHINCILLPENIKSNKDIDSFFANIGRSVWLNQYSGDTQQALVPIKNSLKAHEKHKQNTSRELKKNASKLQAIKACQLDFNPNEYISEIKEFLLKL